MAKKKSKNELNIDDENLDDDEEKGGFVNVIVVIAIIAIWLAIFALLIKMDVGGIGSMLRPYLKNVPGISLILPDASDDEAMEETGFKYRNLAEAVERIKELENEIASYQENEKATADEIAQLKAEIERLKVFEENQKYFQEQKEQFDREIVYNDNAPDLEDYQKWYETMNPENAAKIYEEVAEKVQYSKKVKEWVDTFSKMDADKAAAVLEEMTGDTDLVAKILSSLTSKQRAAIMQEMDSVYAAKLTKIMYPE